ncbi:MAG: hypothetical protein ACI8RD_005852 [Bacillariaceae sp.]|jgi:hypothetical protein
MVLFDRQTPPSANRKLTWLGKLEEVKKGGCVLAVTTYKVVGSKVQINNIYMYVCVMM